MTIGSLRRMLTVTPAARVLGFEAFTSNDLWTPAGRTLAFGGQVVAQSLMAASHTVEDKDVHSQHSYFLLPASSSKPITYTVERLREGKSYCTRLVHAIQDSRTIFILMASFSSAARPLDPVDEEQPDELPDIDAVVSKFYPPRPFVREFYRPFPEDITPYPQATREQDHWKEYLQEAKERGVDLGQQKQAIEAYIDERSSSPVGISVARKQIGKWGSSRAVWLKPQIESSTLSTNTIRCLFAFMTDFQLLLTAGRTVGLSATSHPPLGMVASLDHSMHFYPLPANFDPAAPLLHVMETEAADVEIGRGLTRGLLYTQDGHLVATTSQEGAIRAARGGKVSSAGTPVSL